MIKRILGIVVACYFLASCKPLNPSIMFRTPKDFKYDTQVKDTTKEYRIAANDAVSFRLFTNNGLKLVDVTEGNQQMFQQLNQGITYTVEFDGMINLPIIGRVNVNGMTVREAEFFLESRYDEVFIDPFLLLNVINRRITIFPGNGGDGVVITLQNNNIKLLEALALAGGLADQGRASRIKLIRGNLADPEVYLIDLRTISGISQADIILQANDIIYVEPVGIRTRQVISEIAPIFGIITSAITFYVLIQSLQE
ncbi:MAG: polysaccharide export outer membrane protein [Vicingaceae bacterium]|jgi:polysaccharide export outer membrane protein